MTFYILETDEYFEVTLCVWPNLDIDTFGSLESEHYKYDPEYEAYPISKEDFSNLVSFWREEVEHTNRGEENIITGNYFSSKEYVLFVDKA